MRLRVTLDAKFVEEALRLSAARSKREAIEAALREFVRRRRVERATARGGKVALTLSVSKLLRGRAEE